MCNPYTTGQLLEAAHAFCVEVLTDGGAAYTVAQELAAPLAAQLACTLQQSTLVAIANLYKTRTPRHNPDNDWERFCCGEADDDIEPMRKKYKITRAEMAKIDDVVMGVL